MTPIVVITTLPSREQARQLAKQLVEKGLAACAQMEAIESLYLWEGRLQEEEEIRLTLKAPEHLYAAIEAAILEHHPYDLPAIHAIRVDQVHAAYGSWVSSLNGNGPCAADRLEP